MSGSSETYPKAEQYGLQWRCARPIGSGERSNGESLRVIVVSAQYRICLATLGVGSMDCAL